MRSTQIVPDVQRSTFTNVIGAADKFVAAAALTGHSELIAAANQARREAWAALNEYDAAATASFPDPDQIEDDPRADPATMDRAARAAARIFAESETARSRFVF